MASTMYIRIGDEALCTDCGACELACSFHHIGAFSPFQASISVHRDRFTNKRRVTLSRERDGKRFPCENCGFCIQFCTRGVIQYEKKNTK